MDGKEKSITSAPLTAVNGISDLISNVYRLASKNIITDGKEEAVMDVNGKAIVQASIGPSVTKQQSKSVFNEVRASQELQFTVQPDIWPESSGSGLLDKDVDVCYANGKATVGGDGLDEGDNEEKIIPESDCDWCTKNIVAVGWEGGRRQPLAAKMDRLLQRTARS